MYQPRSQEYIFTTHRGVYIFVESPTPAASDSWSVSR